MKTPILLPLALAASVLMPFSRAADQPHGATDTNRLGVSARFGLNISARFTSAGTFSLPVSPRQTPNGHLYNYDDGYVLTDVSGNVGGQTWYWGYDDSAAQVSGNTVLMNRTLPSSTFRSPAADAEPSLGVEITYARQLGHVGGSKLHWGVEAAVNYQNLDLDDRTTYFIDGVRTTDAFAFTPGTTPPAATPGSPYQGTFGGPGFVIGSTPSSTASTTIPNAAAVTGQRQFCADVWGFRVGPYLEIPVCSNLNAFLSGGLAGGYLDGRATWTETISYPGGLLGGGGSAADSEMLWGYYLAATAQWRLNERWSVLGGVQYQSLEDYRRNVGARNVEVNLDNSLFLTIGLGYNF